MKAKHGLWMMLMVAAVCAAGCSKGEQTSQGQEASKEPSKEPYTLFIYASSVAVDEFNDRFKATLEKKFPHITFKYSAGGKGEAIADLVARGEIPDIIRTSIPTLASDYLDLGIGQDMRSFVTKNKYDLKRFEAPFINEMTDAGKSGELYGLPVPPYYPLVLFYNRDLFDRFGVPYPKDGTSWDDVYDTARKMSRLDGGTNYRGFNIYAVGALRDNPYSLPILDPKSDQLADMDKWKTIFDNFSRFFTLPNNAIEKTVNAETDAFVKGNVAMHINSFSIAAVNKVPKDANWDIVSYPTMKGAPQVTGQRGPAYWSLTKQGKHQEEAFQVIMHMLSDEVQMSDSRKGATTTLNNKEIQNALGKDHPVYSTKNMKAISVY
ncbi:MAG: extracellular solute-binding protein family 1, partial [Paenibacillus sp.]|nr:extracellular solute-binding protein family 1 [Paenibacillus sp.]